MRQGLVAAFAFVGLAFQQQAQGGMFGTIGEAVDLLLVVPVDAGLHRRDGRVHGTRTEQRGQCAVRKPAIRQGTSSQLRCDVGSSYSTRSK